MPRLSAPQSSSSSSRTQIQARAAQRGALSLGTMLKLALGWTLLLLFGWFYAMLPIAALGMLPFLFFGVVCFLSSIHEEAGISGDGL